MIEIENKKNIARELRDVLGKNIPCIRCKILQKNNRVGVSFHKIIFDKINRFNRPIVHKGFIEIYQDGFSLDRIDCDFLSEITNILQKNGFGKHIK